MAQTVQRSLFTTTRFTIEPQFPFYSSPLKIHRVYRNRTCTVAHGLLLPVTQIQQSMATDGTKAIKGGKTQGPSQEEIIHGFNQLRNEQRQLISKVSELEAEQNEHKLVIETLDEVEESRKCFRLVGGVLVERTVKEVLPALVHNKEQLTKTIELLNKQVTSKGLDINSYKEKHNIQVRGGDFQNKNKEEAKEEKSTNSQGVLVESKS